MEKPQSFRRITLPAGILLLLWSLLLAGCAGVKPSQQGAAKPAKGAETPAGGVVIMEEEPADSATRSDFQAAIELLKAEKYEQGIQLLKGVSEREPKLTAPYINMAIAYGKLGKLEPAEENLKKALELNPDHPVPNNEYGMLCRKTGRFAEARTFYEKALDTYPDFHPARKNLGILCDLYLNDPACALAQYEAYGKAVPEDDKVQLWIVDLQRRQ